MPLFVPPCPSCHRIYVSFVPSFSITFRSYTSPSRPCCPFSVTFPSSIADNWAKAFGECLSTLVGTDRLVKFTKSTTYNYLKAKPTCYKIQNVLDEFRIVVIDKSVKSTMFISQKPLSVISLKSKTLDQFVIWILWRYRQLYYLFVYYYPRDAMLARVIAIATCLSVCLSVRLFVTRRYCAKTKKASVMISSPSGRPMIPVFWCQISLPNSKGFPQSGGLKEGWGKKIQRFSSFKRQYLENGSRYDQS